MLSVIIPAYQCADTLEHTVDSILHAGLSDYEIIIVDDGSTDETAGICDLLAKKYGQIRCIHQENAGVSAARNKGLQEANGDYIWFFDSDDSVDPNAMQEVRQILADETPDMLVFGMSFDCFHNGKRNRRDEALPPEEGRLRACDYSNQLYRLFACNSLSSLCNRIMNRSLLSRWELKLCEDMFLYEDLEFSLRVLKHCDSIYFVRKAIYRYRQAEDGSNAGRRLMRVPHIPALLDQIESALEDEPDKNRILLSLYLTLAREKIGVAPKKEIETVCRDFRSWIDERNLLPSIEHRKYPMMIYKAQIARLIAKRSYSKIRHCAANWVKQNIGDFRKWRQPGHKTSASVKS